MGKMRSSSWREITEDQRRSHSPMLADASFIEHPASFRRRVILVDQNVLGDMAAHQLSLGDQCSPECFQGFHEQTRALYASL
jgi:hypothetical protein